MGINIADYRAERSFLGTEIWPSQLFKAFSSLWLAVTTLQLHSSEKEALTIMASL
jgi:hypothetical protein